eukprot:CAMPEP_0181497014 /NCGR_PEP_ID=MMETSP1110-20121109/53308_1 /TAXON_ID=174948 /ORGANISM="Symbiodinium sp., Strain CCMP421" /LENGTH=34 /DNA_ID= /DNA_START= /DNA_END= /DNA_ORIENTATION=
MGAKVLGAHGGAPPKQMLAAGATRPKAGRKMPQR